MLIHSLKGARIRLADAGFNLATNAISRAQWLSLILDLIYLIQQGTVAASYPED
jgi:hypothetical protein